MTRARRYSAGFGLLEVLVALAISGLALAGLSGFVAQSGRLDLALRASERERGQSDGLFRVLGMLLDAPALEMQNAARATIVGTRHSLSVIGRGPAILGLQQDTVFEVRFEPRGGDKGEVILEWTKPGAGSRERERIAADVSGFELSYLARGGATAEGWPRSWAQPVAELVAVEASVTVAEGRGRRTRLMVIRPTLPRPCVVDPLREGCPAW